MPPGVNEMRLSAPEWVAVLAILAAIALVTPPLWERLEQFHPNPDYRIPYALSRDYWLYGRYLRRVADSHPVVVLGDSVVWGEYVAPDGTLSHFLNGVAGETNRFANAGLNGLFPLALEGLLRHHGQALRRQKIILHANPLWLTSPEADLSTTKEQPFNHARLVPQFHPRIPCYRADPTERLSAAIEQHCRFFAWVSHLQNACFDQQSLPQWTLADNDTTPPRYPNAWRNPLSAISLRIPNTLPDSAERGPDSPRHKPWSTKTTGTTHFQWVAPEHSLQWHALQRVIRSLRARGNDVLVLVGPFNEHLMAPQNRPAYRTIRTHITHWLYQNQIPHVLPETLPSLLYADASHPMTAGYALLAKRLWETHTFQAWLRRPHPPRDA